MIARLPRRDLISIVGSLAAITGLCWWYLIDLAGTMGAMEMSQIPLGVRRWDLSYFLMMFLMWAVMMVGMMLPSATPTVLIYAAIVRKARRDGNPVAPTSAFVVGYLLMWIGFSVAATIAQWQLDEAALLSPAMASGSASFGAALLIAAGVYQWLPIKNVCLERCRNPVQFIADNWHSGIRGALLLGLRHGVYCVGCCWVLMGLLFFGGVMNLLWIAIITAFVLLEKGLDFGRFTSRGAGLVMLVLGGWMLLAT